VAADFQSALNAARPIQIRPPQIWTSIMRIIRISAFFLAFLSAGLALAIEEDNKSKEKGEKPSKKPKGKFTIGKETTYVTGPLDKDGYIDYAAALNERMGKGVTPENNANVLIWKAIGPRPEGGAGMPVEFFKLMGIAAPPEKGDYFIDFFRYQKERSKNETEVGGKHLYDQHSRVARAPWSAKDYPAFASWLKANENPLADFIEATKRSHYFSPAVPARRDLKSAGLSGALYPGLQKCREAAHALAARAMLRPRPRGQAPRPARAPVAARSGLGCASQRLGCRDRAPHRPRRG
jgi:hypothetical protein